VSSPCKVWDSSGVTHEAQTLEVPPICVFIYVGSRRETISAGGRLAHPLPALHGSDAPFDKANQQG